MNCEILTNNIESKILLVNDTKLQVFDDGRTYRFTINGDMKLVKNTPNHSKGYNQINCKGKMIKRHRLIGFAFLGLDINDSDKQVDHIDGQKTNNCVNNLRLVTNQQNSFNRTTAKGFHFDKQRQKYKAQIRLNGKDIHLGYFSTEAEARASYLSAKLVYHKIN